MTYFGVLVRFLVIPIAILGVLTYRDWRRGRKLPAAFGLLPPGWLVAAHAIIALTYTTPWDNYLVATGVWWYDPALVTGITLGWVPLEEYTFFVLQPALAGLWLLFLARRLPAGPSLVSRRNMRVVSAVVVGTVWVAAAALLASGWPPGNYLALILVWALPPIALQVAVGADILWRHRRLVSLALATTTLYLCGVDAFAIHGGTWTINPALTTGILLGGVLPVEEAIFFLLTTTLLVFGVVLGLAQASAERLPQRFMTALTKRGGPSAEPATSTTYS